MHLSIFISVLSLATYTVASEALCIQGCCDSKIELPSSQLKLIPTTTDAKETTITLAAAELVCCECPAIDVASLKQKILHNPNDDPVNAVINCPEDDCIPNLCRCDGARRRKGGYQARSLCPAGECDPENCMCTEEVVLGIHDMVFGSSDKDGSRTIGIVNAFAERLGLPKFVPRTNEGKDEL